MARNGQTGEGELLPFSGETPQPTCQLTRARGEPPSSSAPTLSARVAAVPSSRRRLEDAELTSLPPCESSAATTREDILVVRTYILVSDSSRAGGRTTEHNSSFVEDDAYRSHASHARVRGGEAVPPTHANPSARGAAHGAHAAPGVAPPHGPHVRLGGWARGRLSRSRPIAAAAEGRRACGRAVPAAPRRRARQGGHSKQALDRVRAHLVPLHPVPPQPPPVPRSVVQPALTLKVTLRSY